MTWMSKDSAQQCSTVTGMPVRRLRSVQSLTRTRARLHFGPERTFPHNWILWLLHIGVSPQRDAPLPANVRSAKFWSRENFSAHLDFIVLACRRGADTQPLPSYRARVCNDLPRVARALRERSCFPQPFTPRTKACFNCQIVARIARLSRELSVGRAKPLSILRPISKPAVSVEL